MVDLEGRMKKSTATRWEDRDCMTCDPRSPVSPAASHAPNDQASPFRQSWPGIRARVHKRVVDVKPGGKLHIVLAWGCFCVGPIRAFQGVSATSLCRSLSSGQSSSWSLCELVVQRAPSHHVPAQG